MNMSNAAFGPVDQIECKFVEILTAEMSGDVIGYRFGGSQPGPNALIAADAVLIEALFDRLNALPTLPWMWGKLYLVALDDFDCSDMDNIKDHLADVALDELVMLPNADGHFEQGYAVDRAYWATLRLCSRLGMIEGRGVNVS